MKNSEKNKTEADGIENVYQTTKHRPKDAPANTTGAAFWFKTIVAMLASSFLIAHTVLVKEDDDFILFAGYVKKGENAEKTVPREIKEELGVNVVKSKYMSSRYHSQRDVLMLNFIVVVEDMPLKVNAEEISEVRWCSFDEAAQLIRKGTTAEYFLNNAIKELKRKI